MTKPADDLFSSDPFACEDGLPELLPSEPFTLIDHWLTQAHQLQKTPNPHSVCLCTVSPDGLPEGRMVLAKHLDVQAGYVVFHTNYQSAKGKSLIAHPHAALVFHWDQAGRQVRIQGPVLRSPATESDTYFATRPISRQLGAWASQQSQPMASRDELIEAIGHAMVHFGITVEQLMDEQGSGETPVIPRPDYWGGFRLWAQSVELWVNNQDRIHDRARWTRTLQLREDSDDYQTSPWSASRLFP